MKSNEQDVAHQRPQRLCLQLSQLHLLRGRGRTFDVRQKMDVNSEIAHKAMTLPHGSLRRFKGSGTGTEEDVEAFLVNQQEIGTKIVEARAAGCHLEELSLIVQIIDFWLRVWFVNTASPGQLRTREFGGLLSQCVKLGFDSALAKRIESQNKKRVLAIHGYLIGRIGYEEFEDIAKELRIHAYQSLIFVINNCGEIVTDFDGKGSKSEMIIDVFGLTNSIRARIDGV